MSPIVFRYKGYQFYFFSREVFPINMGIVLGLNEEDEKLAKA